MLRYPILVDADFPTVSGCQYEIEHFGVSWKMFDWGNDRILSFDNLVFHHFGSIFLKYLPGEKAMTFNPYTNNMIEVKTFGILGHITIWEFTDWDIDNQMVPKTLKRLRNYARLGNSVATHYIGRRGYPTHFYFHSSYDREKVGSASPEHRQIWEYTIHVPARVEINQFVCSLPFLVIKDTEEPEFLGEAFVRKDD